MKRDIYQKLFAWKSSPRRKPLILNGARQVGKTFALRYFAKAAYAKHIYLNFEKDRGLAAYFEGSLDPKRLIQMLALHTDVDIEKHNTLLIFDEVQECPRALNSLKYFCEEANEYHVAAAGSLLGVKTARSAGFPVGKVNFLHLYPLSFFEFLSAVGKERLRSHLESLEAFIPIAAPIHQQLNELLREYLFVGGMPEAVKTFIKHGKPALVREVQTEILDAYERDFAKHAPNSQLLKITSVWQQAHHQLARENKKFVYSALRKSARGRDYEESIAWLVEAGLLHKSTRIKKPGIPLSAYAEPHIFKLFLLDTGLLAAQAGLSAKALIHGSQLFTEFKGALTENYVAQELICRRRSALHYWASQGTAEIDFVIEDEQRFYPLEVKAGVSSKKKSLLVFGQKYKDAVLSRATLMNLKKDGKIANYPLYLVSRFPL